VKIPNSSGKMNLVVQRSRSSLFGGYAKLMFIPKISDKIHPDKILIFQKVFNWGCLTLKAKPASSK